MRRSFAFMICITFFFAQLPLNGFLDNFKEFFTKDNLKSVGLIVIPVGVCAFSQMFKNQILTQKIKQDSSKDTFKNVTRWMIFGFVSGLCSLGYYHYYLKQTPEQVIAQYGKNAIVKLLN